MRELTKSFNRFSLVTAVFGFEQLARLLTLQGREPGVNAALRSFDSVSRVVEEELAGGWRRSFEAVDDLQRTIVDASFGLLTLDARRAVQGASDTLQRSVQATRHVFSWWS